jgi:hypothetical protein
MALKLFGIAFARDADHKPEVPVQPCLNSREGILDDNRPFRLNLQQLGPIENVSGAGFPARC